MGFFDKIFGKKNCDICGEEIGLLGNRKLEDGNCCKTCARKLSPWFDDRRHSTIEQIKDQLAYREQNQKDLETFLASAVIGEYYKMFIEMKNGIPTRFLVSSSDDFKEENADIIPFANVSACMVDIDEDRKEIMRTNENNERVSYDPKRYEYDYDFNIKLTITGIPYFDDIQFKLNSRTLTIEPEEKPGVIKILLFSNNEEYDPMKNAKYREYKEMCDSIRNYISCGQQGIPYVEGDGVEDEEFIKSLTAAGSNEERAQMLMSKARTCLNPTLKQKYLDMAKVYGADITAIDNAPPATTQAPVQAPAQTPAAAPVSQSLPKWVCPACGNQNDGKFCQGCGAPKPTEQIAGGWTCFCGTQNTGKFCENCGIEKFDSEDVLCSECSWTVEPGDRIPSVCPNCGKQFDANDIN